MAQPEEHADTVRRIIEHMEAMYGDETLTLGRMSEEVYYTPSYLDRLFRRFVGIPPRLFLSALRMREAKRQLLSTPLAATEIGSNVGFASLGTFTSRFASYVGVPPGQFRACAEAIVDSARAYRPAGTPNNEAPAENVAVRGFVQVPAAFDGVVCIGLFDKPFPVGHPAACTLTFASGAYELPSVADGRYYVMAVAIPWEASREEWLLLETSLRCRSGPVDVKAGPAAAPAPLTLRPPRRFDPPILVSMPMLLTAFLSGSVKREEAGPSPGPLQ
ncbi:helix-turn-helix transcriptional regulator [Paenibacillus sp. TRM 82003]|nr:helix-turn-helix transcriptional regulator [Paenibacillus sp. TRM 82003]